jgi:hypothetical protein
MCLGILLANVYFWATYVRLEHYLLVPWLVLVIGAAVTLEGVAQMLAARPAWVRGLDLGPFVGAASVAFAVELVLTTWRAADRSDDRSGDVFVDTVLQALPANAAILSEWDASTPLWHARNVLDRRHDVLIVDDTNIVYEGWGTRERRIASLICERPVFILRLRDTDQKPTRAQFQVEPFITVDVAAGGPTATITQQVYEVAPRDPAACGG